MTRLIDADALNKKLCETTIFIKDGEKFQRMINDAPTIEPDGDTISRRAAVAMFEKHCYPITYDKASREKGMTITGIRELLGSLPSAPDSRQRGEWLRNDKIGTFKIFTCDKCGCNMDTDAWDFCPNCGSFNGGREGD